MESSRSAMAILKVDHQIFYLKPGFHLIGSDKNLEIYLNSEAIDEKHALLEISSHGIKIIDLQTKNGTFITGNKIDSVKLIELPRKCSIQFGNITGYIKLVNENDSGFLEKANSKDSSEIIVSSPEQNPETHTFYLHSKEKKKITSTPNNSITRKTEYLSLSSKDDNDNLIKDKSYNRKMSFSNSNCNDSFKGDNNSNKSSFFVPETQSIASTSIQKQRKISNSINHDSIKEDEQNKSSFFVPETQPFVVPPKNSTNTDTISTNPISVAEEVCKNIGNISENDELCIPETQDIFQDDNKIQNLNSQFGSLYHITTQEFNGTAAGNENLDALSVSSNDSENLFKGIQLPGNISSNKSTKELEKSTNIENVFITDDDDYDVEMSALKWSETNQYNRKNCLPSVRSSISPDFLIEVNTMNNNRSNTVTPDLIFDPDFNVITKKEEDESGNILQETIKKTEFNMEPTQIFIKPKQENCKKSVEMNDDIFEPTQLFLRPQPLSNNSDKENVIDSHVSKDKKNEMDNKLSINNQHIDNFNSMEPTQLFIQPKINNVPESNGFMNFILDSDEDEISPNKSNIINKRNKLMSSSDDDGENLESDKFKTPITCCIKKTDSNCSSDGTISNKKKKYSISSTNSEDHFEFLTSTPQFDLIKPHQSNYIKEVGNFNIKSKNKKILLEPSSDDDDSQDIDKLLNHLNNKNDNKQNSIKNTKMSSNMETERKSTKRKNTAVPPENRTRQNLKSNDSTNLQTRRSTRTKNLPNYINQSYILDNFTEVFCSELDYKQTEKPSRKRPHNTKLDDECLPKATKTSQRRGGRKKDTQNKLLSTGNDEPKEKCEKEITNNVNLPSSSGNCRVTRRNNNTLKHKFVFTIVDESKYRDIIESMGGEIVDKPKDATILITNRIVRTCKFMVALARGIPIVSHKWLDRIIEFPSIATRYTAFLIDDPQNENKFGFSLTSTLKLSSKNSIFKNHTFLITPKTTPPPNELIQIIACTGGQYVKEIPKGSIDISKFYVVSDKKDNNYWPKIKKTIPNVKIINTEGILLSVMQHKLRFNDYLLE